MKTFQEYQEAFLIKLRDRPDLTMDQLKDVLKKLRIKWVYASEIGFRKTPYGYEGGHYEIKIPNGVIFQYRPMSPERVAAGMGTVLVNGVEAKEFRDIPEFTKVVKKYSKLKKT